jgi:hypothetical protein
MPAAMWYSACTEQGVSLIGTYTVTGLALLSSVMLALLVEWMVLEAIIRSLAPAPAKRAASPIEPE